MWTRWKTTVPRSPANSLAGQQHISWSMKPAHPDMSSTPMHFPRISIQVSAAGTVYLYCNFSVIIINQCVPVYCTSNDVFSFIIVVLFSSGHKVLSGSNLLKCSVVDPKLFFSWIWIRFSSDLDHDPTLQWEGSDPTLLSRKVPVPVRTLNVTGNIQWLYLLIVF
jgi:hypothetical protein